MNSIHSLARADGPRSLTVDLLGRFAATLHDGGSLGDGALPDSMLRRLLRPLATGQPIDAPRQLATWLERAVAADGLPAAARGQVENAWRRTVDGWQQRARRDAADHVLGAEGRSVARSRR